MLRGSSWSRRMARGASTVVMVALVGVSGVVASGEGASASEARSPRVAAAAGPLVSVSSGRFHSCGVARTGGVKCWGANGSGQLGNGTLAADSPPGSVIGLTAGTTAVSASGDHTCALGAAGGLRCWGSNDNGELGTLPSAGGVSVPVVPDGMAGGVTAVSAGWTGTCAVKGGAAWCWGFPFGGAAATIVPGLGTGVLAVATGWFSVCAATTSGVRCWSPHHGTVPVAGLTGPGIASLAGQLGAGGFDTYCAARTTGQTLCFRDDVVRGVTPAVPVDGLPAATKVAVTLRGQACAVAGGTISCWDVYPSRVPGLHTVAVPQKAADVSGGLAFDCAVNSWGRAFCWGANDAGQLGDGTRTDRVDPVPVKGLA